MASVGTGATLTLSTSSYDPEIIGMNWNGISREVIESSHLGTETARTFIGGDLYDPGELEIEVFWEPDGAAGTVIPDYNVKTPETITVTMPSGDTFAASGFIQNFSFGTPLEDRMTATISFKFSGTITETVS